MVAASDERVSLPAEYVGKLVELVPVVGPLLGPLGERAAENVGREWARNRSVALKAAERTSGLSHEDLAKAIATVPGVIPLTLRVLWAAGINGYDPVLKGMGATLGQAVRESELIDEAELVVAAMADFGPSHRAVLEALEGVPDGEAWPLDKLVEHVDAPRSVVRMAVSALPARGLVNIHAGYGGGVPYSLSDLGRTVLDVLRAYEQDADSAE